MRQPDEEAIAGDEPLRKQSASDTSHFGPRLGVGPALDMLAVHEAEGGARRELRILGALAEAFACQIKRLYSRTHVPNGHDASWTTADIEPRQRDILGSGP